jgi:hypothetical protein
MTLANLHKCPWPYAGGKTHAAPLIWAALGDVPHFVDPFMGSLAALLLRPHAANRTYHSETVNDLDGLLVNAWRSIQLHPEETAEAASNPVCEADLHARHAALLRFRAEHELERLMGDPDWCDPRAAGYWIWGQSCWIGSGWCSGRGPWVVDASGRLVRREGVGAGVGKKLPHLGDDGQGVNHAGAREEGVARQLPRISDDGQGVNHAGAREEGVARQLPRISDDGRGVNHPCTKERGVSPEAGELEFHDVTMPEIRRWFRFLSARLRHVRILNGDWKRAVTGGASKILAVRQGAGPCGVLLDPPYDASLRDKGLYTCDDDGSSISDEVRAWALAHGDDPQYRIVVCGFGSEHDELLSHSWRKIEWYTRGFLRGGMANTGEEGTHQAEERLWLSPHCLLDTRQVDLFGEEV